MSFELEELKVVSPSYPSERERYYEPVKHAMEYGEIENIYEIRGRKKDYINPNGNGEISWCNIFSFDTD